MRLFWISKIVISDIQNKRTILDNQNSYFDIGNKCTIRLFWISEITILDIQKNYFRYQK